MTEANGQSRPQGVAVPARAGHPLCGRCHLERNALFREWADSVETVAPNPAPSTPTITLLLGRSILRELMPFPGAVLFIASARRLSLIFWRSARLFAAGMTLVRAPEGAMDATKPFTRVRAADVAQISTTPPADWFIRIPANPGSASRAPRRATSSSSTRTRLARSASSALLSETPQLGDGAWFATMSATATRSVVRPNSVRNSRSRGVGAAGTNEAAWTTGELGEIGDPAPKTNASPRVMSSRRLANPFIVRAPIPAQTT